MSLTQKVSSVKADCFSLYSREIVRVIIAHFGEKNKERAKTFSKKRHGKERTRIYYQRTKNGRRADGGKTYWNFIGR